MPNWLKTFKDILVLTTILFSQLICNIQYLKVNGKHILYNTLLLCSKLEPMADQKNYCTSVLLCVTMRLIKGVRMKDYLTKIVENTKAAKIPLSPSQYG